jgi:hypothetical protein
MKKSITVLAVAGAFAFVPSFASAFSGTYVECIPTAGVKALVTVKKGFDCTEKANKLQLSIGAKTANGFDNCDAVSGGAPWDVWAAGKFGSKITQANAALIDSVDLKAKGSAFGSCNLSGSVNSGGASMGGKYAFIAANGDKVKGGKGKFGSRVGADLPSQSAALNGVVTKGFGQGGVIRILAGLDAAAPENSDLVACNLGFLCPPDPNQPIGSIALITNAASVFRIGSPVNSDCLGINDPWDCCTGAAAGSCDD